MVKNLHFTVTNVGDQFSFILTCFVRIVLPPWWRSLGWYHPPTGAWTRNAIQK